MPVFFGAAGSGGSQPSAPTIGITTAGDSQITVAFTESAYIGKGTVTYTVIASSGGPSVSGVSPLIITGLSNGISYTFTVVATTNYNVTSAASSASSPIDPAAPITPTLPNPTFGSCVDSAQYQFQRSIANYDAANTYIISASAGSISRSAAVMTVTGLGNSQSSTIYVRSSRPGYIESAQTNATCTSRAAPPPPPPPPAPACVAVTWDGVTYSCVGTLSYQYWRSNNGATPPCSGEGGYNGAYRDGICGYAAPAPICPPLYEFIRTACDGYNLQYFLADGNCNEFLSYTEVNSTNCGFISCGPQPANPCTSGGGATGIQGYASTLVHVCGDPFGAGCSGRGTAYNVWSKPGCASYACYVSCLPYNSTWYAQNC